MDKKKKYFQGSQSGFFYSPLSKSRPKKKQTKQQITGFVKNLTH